MAGSYEHCVADDGQLLRNKDFVDMIQNLGDAYDAVEEMYGMIWWLASTVGGDEQATVVRAARDNYLAGLEQSPGTDGRLGYGA